MTYKPEDIKGLLEKAGDPNWSYRPYEHDDWGVIRHATPNGDGWQFPIAKVSTCEVTESTKQEFRSRRFLDGEDVCPVEGVGQLITAAPTLARQLLELMEENERLLETQSKIYNKLYLVREQLELVTSGEKAN